MTMTTRDKADKAAEKAGSGKGGPSNEAGTARGPGSSAGAAAKHGEGPEQNQGAGSAKTERNRPGHKAGG